MTKAINSRSQWESLESVAGSTVETGNIELDGLRSGDILIKHVFPDDIHRGAIEKMIRLGNMVHIFDFRGSKYSEHAALVGDVECWKQGGNSNRPHLFEAVGEGILVRSASQMKMLWQRTRYTVYRMFPQVEDNDVSSRENMEAICNGFATRLAKVQQYRGVRPVTIAPSVEPTIRNAVRGAHQQTEIVQRTRYGYGNMVTSATPNLVPDGVFTTSHGKRALDFIVGDKEQLAYICSALAAVLLEAWSRNTRQHRIWTDPAQAHPCMIEHQFANPELGWGLLGRWGKLQKTAADYQGLVGGAADRQDWETL